MNKIIRLTAVLLCLLGLGSLAFYHFRPQEPGALHWDAPVVKKSLMTFAYKVYGNPSAQNGRNFVSKIVFHNDGQGMVRNFSISYQIPDYVPWTTEETHAEIPPGQTVVKLFYPQLPAKVTQLTNQTTATLETKVRWMDKLGEQREEILRSNIELRGVNEVEYTDLPKNEILTWYDVFAATPFITAMVTPNDPVVKEFCAVITQRTGGTTAGIVGGSQEVWRIMKALYDYMCDTNMRYTSDQGVPATLGDVRTIVQTVRMPRDVIITNQGLCVELALLWSSVMEHFGLRTTVVFRPGHAFTLVWFGTGQSDFFAIECTAITPMAVGKTSRVAFEDAVKMAQQDLRDQKYQIWLNIQQHQAEGFRPPELPSVEIDKIKDILAKRTAGGNTNPAGNGNVTKNADAGGEVNGSENAKIVPVNPGGDQVLPQGFMRWFGAGGMVSVAIPSYWARLENPGIAGMILTAEDPKSFVAVNIFHFPQLQTAHDAMQTAQRNVTAANGAKVKVATTQQKGTGVIYTGTTSSRNGTHMWVGMFQPTPKGVVGVFIGSPQQAFKRNLETMQTLIQYARLGNGQ